MQALSDLITSTSSSFSLAIYKKVVEVMDDGLTPLGASTPKKAKLDDTDYVFLSDSDGDDSLLFLSSGPEELGGIPSGTDSVLFISTTTDTTDDASMNTTLIPPSESEDDDDDVSKQAMESAVLEKMCCDEKCMQNFSFKEYKMATEHFKSKTNSEQRQFLLDSIILSQTTGATSASVQKFMLYGKSVCRKAFALLLNTSERRFERIKHTCGTAVKIAHGNQGVKRPTNKTMEAAAWMNSYFTRMGDHMPDSDRIHLPSFLTKGEVYQKMYEELSEMGITNIISRSTFYELWDKDFCHVLIPEVFTCLHAILPHM